MKKIMLLCVICLLVTLSPVLSSEQEDRSRLVDRMMDSNRHARAGMMLMAKYEYEGAIKEYEAALESYREFKKLEPKVPSFFLRMDDMAILYLDNIAFCYKNLFDTEKAMACYDQALAMSRSLNLKGKELDSTVHLAEFCLECSDYTGFEKYRKKSLELIHSFPPPSQDPVSPESILFYEHLNMVRDLETARSGFLISLNRFDEVLRAAGSRECKERQQQLLKWASPESFAPILARVDDESLMNTLSTYHRISMANMNDALMMTIGKVRCLRGRGDYEEAMKVLDSAASCLEPGAGKSQQKLIAILEGRMREKKEETDKIPYQVCISFLKDLENFGSSSTMAIQRISFKAHKARLYDLTGDWKKAMEIYEALIRESDTIPPYYRRIMLPRLYNLMSQALLDGGNAGKAMEYAEKARALIPLGIQNMTMIETNTALRGSIYEQQGDGARAGEAFRTAIDLTEKLRYFNVSAGELENFLEGRLIPYEGMVRILLKEGKSGEALEFVEKCRARALTEHFGHGLAAVGLTDKEQYHLFTLQLRSLQVRQAMKDTESSGKEISPEKIKEAEEKLAGIRSEYIASLTPEKANLVLGTTVKVAQVQKLLDDETAIIDYFYDSQSPENIRAARAWVITSHSVAPVTLTLNPRSIENKVAHLRRLIQEQDSNWTNVAKELRQGLIAPVEKYVEGRKRLVICPYRALHYLPFSALLDSKDRPLIDNHSIVIIPSLAALAYCSEKKSTVNGKLVAFSLGSLTVEGHPPLPGTEREVSEIRKIYPDSMAVEGRDFVKERIQEQIGGAGRIHFATHGYVSADDPKGSGLLTADGFFTVPEIMALRTGPALVVLSACNTGMGKVFPGDDQVSVMRSFMIAGSPSIVSSLWSISDESTVKLMSLFYENLSRGTDRGEALRLAELSLMKEYPAPIHWAPFMITGQWK